MRKFTFITKKAIWHLAILQNWCLGQFNRSRIEVLQIAQLLALVIFVSFFLVRENLRGLRENLKTQNPIPRQLRTVPCPLSPGCGPYAVLR